VLRYRRLGKLGGMDYIRDDNAVFEKLNLVTAGANGLVLQVFYNLVADGVAQGFANQRNIQNDRPLAMSKSTIS